MGNALLVASYSELTTEKEKDPKALEARYGLEDADGNALDRVEDKGALFADLMRFIDEESRDAFLISGKLTGLTFAEERAHGMVGKQDFYFVRIDGRWYIAASDRQ